MSLTVAIKAGGRSSRRFVRVNPLFDHQIRPAFPFKLWCHFKQTLFS